MSESTLVFYGGPYKIPYYFKRCVSSYYGDSKNCQYPGAYPEIFVFVAKAMAETNFEAIEAPTKWSVNWQGALNDANITLPQALHVTKAKIFKQTSVYHPHI